MVHSITIIFAFVNLIYPLYICCADIAHGDQCTKFWCAIRDHPEPPEISSHLSSPSITESIYKPSLVAETSVHH